MRRTSQVGGGLPELVPKEGHAAAVGCNLVLLRPADAVARQLRIRLVPEMVDLGGETLKVVGEYRLPLKLVLPSGDRAALDVSVAST